MRICLVYDCLFPHTVGGAERWYRNLAERLADDGHDVTYLTLRQWDRGEHAQIDARVRVVTRGPADGALHRRADADASCRRWCSGWACSSHLLRHGRRYDVVHTCAFPYFSLLAAALAAAAAALRAGGRLVRGVEPRLLARLPRRASAGASATLVQRAVRARPASAPSASPSCTRSACARRACAAR